MSEYVPDTNLLIRLSVPADPPNALVSNALKTLRQTGDEIILLPQCLYEFYTVATRPTTARGGLGFTIAEADAEIDKYRRLYRMRPDTAAIFDVWHSLVVSYGVSGVAAHDARLVAAMQVHGIANLLTFNAADFARYTHITVLHPQNI